MQKIKNTIDIFKAPMVYIPTAIVLVIILSITLFNNKNGNGEKIKVTRNDVVQTVSVSGKTRAALSADLSFEKSGKITGVYAKVGDYVSAGQVLVRIDSSELYANLSQAEANLLGEESRLSEIKKGTRPEEISMAKTAMDDAKNSLDSKVTDAYTKSDDAIRNNVDQMFDNPRSSNVKINIITNNFQLENEINNLRYEIESMLNDWSTKTSSLPVSTTYSNLDKIKTFLDKVALAVNSLVANSNITQTTIDKYKTAISTARSSIALAYSNLNTAESVYNSAKTSYELKLAGNTQEAINAQTARVAQMQAQVDSIKAQLSKNVIYSPINGLVVKQEAKVGEIANPSITSISIISANKIEVEAYVPEINIGKLSIGNSVSMKLDAFAGEKFTGKLIYIEPAETLIDNTPNFKLRIVFDNDDPRMKSGLSTDVEIEVAKKSGALSLPRYAVSREGDKFFADKYTEKGEIIKTEVVVGIQGDNGFTEILSGLVEGDTVVFGAK